MAWAVSGMACTSARTSTMAVITAASLADGRPRPRVYLTSREGNDRTGAAHMNIGEPIHQIEIVPENLPIPGTLPVPIREPDPTPEPVHT